MKSAVILMNLGTPAAPTAGAIRRYLRDFLSDSRVVEIPRLLWWPILYGPILTLRPRRLIPAYQALWDEHGDSPLRIITQRQVAALEHALAPLGDAAPTVTYALTYGEPSLAGQVAALQAAGAERILVFPLYPQYSATTTGAIYDQVAAIWRSHRDVPDIDLVKRYGERPQYIEALAQTVQHHWQQHGRAERLLLSFHGIPQRNVQLGDPYERECHDTARRLASQLQLADDQWQVSFQSRLGRGQWLQPYTSETLERWGREGVATVDVICPAFAAECLETLEEIAVENRDVFLGAGGGEYRYIPCLNDHPSHIALLAEIVRERFALQ